MVKRQWSAEQSVRYIGWGIRFFLAAALTAAQLPDGAAPLALGCVAASGCGGNGLSALLGTLAGALLFQDFLYGLAQVASAILIFAAASALHGMKLTSKPWFPSVTASSVYLVVRGMYVLQALTPERHLLSWIVGIVLSGISARLYQPLLMSGKEKLSFPALLFLGMSLSAGLWEVTVMGVSPGRIAVCCLTLYAAWSRGSSIGVTAGLSGGLLLDLFSGGTALLCTGTYALSALTAGGRKSRAASAVLWLGTSGLLILLSSGENAMLWETGIAAGIFLLLPRKLLQGKRLCAAGSAAGSAADPDSDSARQKLKHQLTQTAAAFRDLYDSLGKTSSVTPEENPAIIFDRAAEKTCRDCSLCNLCWQKEYNTTFNAFNDATPYLLERGRAMAKDFPPHFSSRCIHLPELLNAMNGELTAFLLRRQYRRQLEETRKNARGQYAQMSDLLSATAAGLGMEQAAFGHGTVCRIGAAMRPKQGETVCGDTVASFETEQGMLCLALSDGMGSGEPARKESAMTIRLLKQFLQAGIEPESALRTLNAAWNLRSAESGSFTTVDLLTLSADGATASAYKFGAAPSYWKKGGVIRRITGRALPAGLRTSPGTPDVTRLHLEPGSFLVMISDGVADSLQDEWLQNLLAGYDGSDPQELAGLILSEAAVQNAPDDDRCVQALYLPKPDKEPELV